MHGHPHPVSILHVTSSQKMFTPPMPGDVLVNFYINLSKLCLIVYQLHVLQPNTTKVKLSLPIRMNSA